MITIVLQAVLTKRAFLFILILIPSLLQAQQTTTQLLDTVREGNHENLRQLIDQGQRLLSPSARKPLLWHAIEAGRISIVEQLLMAGVDVRARGSDGNSVLHSSAVLDNTELMSLLVRYGALVDETNQRGQSALMLAAQAGNAKAVSHLLVLGADTTIRNQDGKTALDLAEAHEQQAEVKLLRGMVDADQSTKRLVQAPGQDLEELIGMAKDGSVIQLAAGVSKSSIYLVDKTVTLLGAPQGGTVLTGGTKQFVVIVGKNANLYARDLTIAPTGAAEYGIYVVGGHAVIVDSTITKSPKAGLVISEGNVTVRRCDFENCKQGISTTGKGSLHVYSSRFVGCPEAGISARGVDTVHVVANQFHGSKLGVTCQELKERLVLRYNTFVSSTEMASSSMGLFVENGRRAVVTDNQWWGFEQGVHISGALDRPLLFHRNLIAGSDIGLSVAVKWPAENEQSGLLDGNLVLGCGRVGLILNGIHRCRLHGNIVSAEDSGIVVQHADSADLTLENDSLVAGRFALRVVDQMPERVAFSDTLMVGTILPDSLPNRLDSGSRRIAAALALTDRGQKMRHIGSAFSTALSDDESSQRDKLRDMVESLALQVGATRSLAGRLVELKVQVVDGLGKTGFVPFRVYETSLNSEAGDVDIKRPYSLIQELNDTSNPVSVFIAEQLPQSLKDHLKQNPDGELTEQSISQLAGTLQSVIQQPAFYSADRFKAVTLSPETFGLIDQEDKTDAETQMLNRYLLEDALGDRINRLRPVMVLNTASEPCYLAEGRYWVIPDSSYIPAKRIEVVGYDDQEVVLSAGASRWFTFLDSRIEKPKTTDLRSVLIRLKPPGELRRSLARLWTFRAREGFIGMLRRDATAEDIAASLKTARERFASLEPLVRSEEMTDEEFTSAQFHFNQTLNAVTRVFSVAGTAEDVQSIAQSQFFGSDQVHAVAYIEARLGTLESGQLARWLADDNRITAVSAAIQLHRYGLSIGDDLLIQNIADEVNGVSRDASILTMLDYPDPALLKALQKRLAAVVDPGSDEEATQPTDGLSVSSLSLWARLYLLSFGTVKDQQRILDDPWELESAPYYLVHTASEPSVLWHLWADYGWEESLWKMAASGIGNHQATSGSPASSLEDIIYQASYRRNFKETDSVRSVQQKANTSVDRSALRSSFFLPSQELAQRMFNSDADINTSRDTPWISMEGQPVEEVMDHFVAGSLFSSHAVQLDYLSHEALNQAFAKRITGQVPAYRDAVLAAHKIASRANLSNRDRYHDGVERRPFVIRDFPGPKAGFGGALSGVVQLRPEFDGRRWTFALRFPMEIAVGSFFGQTEGWAIPTLDAYRNPGQSLVKQVNLYGRGRLIPVELERILDDRTLLFAVEMPSNDLSGLYLDVDMVLGERTHHVIFDMFATDYANSLRRLKSKAQQLASVDAEPSLEAGLLLARARCHAALGETNMAASLFRSAMEKTSSNLQIALELADLYIKAKQHEMAIHVLHRVIQLSPDDSAGYRELAAVYYALGEYGDAASTAAAAVASDPQDKSLRLLHGMSLFLAGDNASASHVLHPLLESKFRQQAIPLWLLASIESEQLDRTELSALLPELRRGLDGREHELIDVLTTGDFPDVKKVVMGSPRLCRLRCYQGYHKLQDGNQVAAKEAFMRAIASGQRDQLEYRLAARVLKQLDQGFDENQPAHTAFGRYENVLRRFAVPADSSRYYEFDDYGHSGTTSYEGHQDLPTGYWVYKYPDWYILENIREATQDKQ